MLGFRFSLSLQIFQMSAQDPQIESAHEPNPRSRRPFSLSRSGGPIAASGVNNGFTYC